MSSRKLSKRKTSLKRKGSARRKSTRREFTVSDSFFQTIYNTFKPHIEDDEEILQLYATLMKAKNGWFYTDVNSKRIFNLLKGFMTPELKLYMMGDSVFLLQEKSVRGKTMEEVVDMAQDKNKLGKLLGYHCSFPPDTTSKSWRFAQWYLKPNEKNKRLFSEPKVRILGYGCIPSQQKEPKKSTEDLKRVFRDIGEVRFQWSTKKITR